MRACLVRLGTAVLLFPLLASSAARAEPLRRNIAPYLFQERCGKRVEEVFNQARKKEDDPMVGFSAHYNVRLNRCLSILEWLGGGVHEISLLDINENTVYGSFMFRFGSAEDLPGAKGVVVCFVGPRPPRMVGDVDVSTFDLQCHSEQEWRTLARPYMEE